MLMNKSRLEKFLYALYSLDSSDLPTPLSRIEELYKCLVTGEEAPTFEPISRVEKYLMAILGVYDVELLPNPLSRVEVLLYKLATGDDNLDDIDSFLSEHEELLAEIIRNGGVGGNIDIEYVLYTLSTEFNTLYNTAEKPVKSAILKGQTLVNHFPPFNSNCWEARNGSVMYDGYVILKANDAADFRPKANYRNYPTLKPSTQYTYIYYVSENVGNVRIGAISGFPFSGSHTGLGVGLHKSLVTTPEEIQGSYISQWFVIYADDRENGYAKITMMMLIEGDWTNTELPFKEHFDGMQSVKMPVLTTSNEDGTKSNILTCNEDVELRGIGTIQDELDLLSGELTERIGEIVLNGGEEGWIYDNRCSATAICYIENYFTTPPTNAITNYFSLIENRVWLFWNAGEDHEMFCVNDTSLAFKIEKSKLKTLDSNGIKEWLSQNNLIIQYELATPIIKTVDLSVVDQDGNDTKLSTFNDITHVTLSSEGLIPEAELEVATKNEEDLEDTSVYTIHTLSEGYNTLYNTAEKPVKSAILMGQMLVNIHPTNYVVAGSKITYFLSKIVPKTMIKPNTRYFLRLYNTHQSIVRAYFKPCVNNTVDLISSDNKCAIFTTKSEFADSDFSNNKIHFYSSSELALEDVKDTKVILCEYVDGMENWDIPYFEGIQSVKMPVLTTIGKNLLNNQNNSKDTTIDANGKVKTYVGRTLSDYVKVSKNKQYVFSGNGNSGNYVAFFDNSKTFIERISADTFTPKQDGYIRVFQYNSAEALYQIEEGSVATEYEPHKSNILTVNEEVELHGIGGIKDELNLLTGEVVRNIGEVVVDGSENFVYPAPNVYRVLVPDIHSQNDSIFVCDTMPTTSWEKYSDESYDGYVYQTIEGFNFIQFKRTEEEFKEFLQKNPITIQYQLAEKPIKKVDLSVVDQDGNNTKLSTFNDITHVTLSSEGLIPEAELEVAEKVTEVAASMLTISREQEVIDTTANEQSENVDATMIATTEIYEELL